MQVKIHYNRTTALERIPADRSQRRGGGYFSQNLALDSALIKTRNQNSLPSRLLPYCKVTKYFSQHQDSYKWCNKYRITTLETVTAKT